ncbi:hypothetical protein [Streptomyces sp. NPDC001500]
MGDRRQDRNAEFQAFVVGRRPRLMRTAFLLTGEQHAPADLVGRSASFVLRSTGEAQAAPQMLTLHGVTTKGDALHGHDVDAVAVPLSPYGQGPARLVIGKAATSARQVTCTWKNGTKTEVGRVPATAGAEAGAPAIRAVDDSRTTGSCARPPRAPRTRRRR